MIYNEYHRKSTGISRSSDKFLERKKKGRKNKQEPQK